MVADPASPELPVAAPTAIVPPLVRLMESDALMVRLPPFPVPYVEPLIPEVYVVPLLAV